MIERGRVGRVCVSMFLTAGVWEGAGALKHLLHILAELVSVIVCICLVVCVCLRLSVIVRD